MVSTNALTVASSFGDDGRRARFMRGGGRCRPCIAIIAFALILQGCAAGSAPRCGAGAQAMVSDLLYFGTDKPGAAVTDAEWSQFLATAVTPRFPAGFTVWRATGQWQAANGDVVREPSYVLNLVHPESEAAEAAITRVMADYKTRFQQEAVLRVKAHACASF
jgi:hypothetical protein